MVIATTAFKHLSALKTDIVASATHETLQLLKFYQAKCFLIQKIYESDNVLAKTF